MVLARSNSDLLTQHHLVHFYDDDHELTGAVVTHFVQALAEGGTAIAVATLEHRVAVADGLDALGMDAAGNSRIKLLDASETLEQILVDGEIDRDLFDQIIGNLIATAIAPVHVFGEMVAELWAAAKVQTAIDLESLWNLLGEREAFTLHCGYPHESCCWEEQADDLARVCDLHTLVVGATPVNTLEIGHPSHVHPIIRELQLPPAVSSLRQARVLVCEVLAERSNDDQETAKLVISELVTNALEHGQGEIGVRVELRESSVVVAVTDQDANDPLLRRVGPTSPRGRGLFIVEQLASSWGVTLGHDGKSVWAEVALSAQKP